MFGGGRWKVMERLVRRYGQLFTLNVGDIGPLVIVCDPVLARSVLTGSSEVLVSGRPNAQAKFLYGLTSVLLQDGKPHARLRKLMVPPFRNKDLLKSYELLMERFANDAFDRVPLNQAVSMQPIFQAATLEIILRIIFGVEDEAVLAPLRGYMKEIISVAISPKSAVRGALRKIGLLKKWPRFDRAMEEGDKLIYAEIKRSRKDPQLEARQDMLALLLRSRVEDGSPLSDVEIRDQLMTLLVAGHETTATTLSWMFEQIVRSPQTLAKLTREVQEGASTDYADALFDETLRLRPPVPVFARETIVPFQLGDYLLPPGTCIAVHIQHIQMRPDLYPDPEEFKPERFLDKKPVLGTYLPFGGGLHSCLGNFFAATEARAFLRVFLKRGTFAAPEPKHESVNRVMLLNKPKKGGRVVLTSRKERVSGGLMV
jgi:cytochrome P450